eukprot:4918527-Lingulodinium_polyedra.AAC.1
MCCDAACRAHPRRARPARAFVAPPKAPTRLARNVCCKQSLGQMKPKPGSQCFCLCCAARTQRESIIESKLERATV